MINDKLTIKYNGIIFKLNKFLFNCKTKLIIKLVGDMPVIMNCDIYDDVFDKNFKYSASYISFNNKLHNFQDYAMRYAKEELSLSTKGVRRNRSGAIVLDRVTI